MFGDDHLSKKKFVKKFKKNPPMGRFLERYLFGDDQDFCWIVKKIEKKFKIFRPLWIFSGRYLYEGRKRDQQYFPCREGKNGKNGKKSDHFRIFVEDTWLERSDGNFNNNAQRAERKKIYDNRHIRFTTKKQSIHYKNKERKIKK